jgi:hypothetical protein
MLGAVVAGVTFPFRLDPARMSARARIFDLCPLFLLFLLILVALAEIYAPGLGEETPLQVIPLYRLPLDVAIFAVPFAWAVRPINLRESWCVLAAASLLPLSGSLIPCAFGLSIHLYPNVLDIQVVAIDATLGMQPSLVLGDAFVRMPTLAGLCGAIYGAIIFPTALVAAMEVQQTRRMGLGALPTFLVLAGIGYVLYGLAPVVGPAPHFGDAFPFPTGRAHFPQPRNCVPSLHTAWVLMAFLASRGMSWPIRFLTGFWLAVILIATVGSGEHYLTDLVVAVPFVLMMRALCASEVPWSTFERRYSLWFGLLLYLIWVLAIRGVINLPAVPGLAPGFMVATVVVALWWERKLARAAGFLTGAGAPWTGFTRRRVAASAAPLSV